MKDRFERGAVVASLDRNWVIWAYPRGRGHVEPLALPLTVQTAPRHRSHVRIEYRGRVHVIHTLEAEALVPSDCTWVAQLPLGTVAEIELVMRRSIQAQELERA